MDKLMLPFWKKKQQTKTNKQNQNTLLKFKFYRKLRIGIPRIKKKAEMVTVFLKYKQYTENA